MERLSLHDPPPGASPGPAQTPQPQPAQPSQQQQQNLGPKQLMEHGPPQLPPQMFTTAAQLLDLTDKKLVLVLRDGRKLVGVLRSWDQFANLVLQDTVERLYAGNLYADIPRGVFLVRGENVLLLGEIDLDREDDMPSHIQQAPLPEVFELKKKEDLERQRGDRKRGTNLQKHGFEVEHSGEILF